MRQAVGLALVALLAGCLSNTIPDDAHEYELSMTLDAWFDEDGGAHQDNCAGLAGSDTGFWSVMAAVDWVENIEGAPEKVYVEVSNDAGNGFRRTDPQADETIHTTFIPGWSQVRVAVQTERGLGGVIKGSMHMVVWHTGATPQLTPMACGGHG